MEAAEYTSLGHFKSAAADGRIFSVTFIKRTTGEVRRMVCRRGVSVGIKGVGMKYSPDTRNLMVVWDVQVGGYRMVSLDSLLTLRMHGRRYEWVSGRGWVEVTNGSQ
jgi:hypothetical protein